MFGETRTEGVRSVRTRGSGIGARGLPFEPSAGGPTAPLRSRGPEGSGTAE
jgi:hypothetical protein